MLIRPRQRGRAGSEAKVLCGLGGKPEALLNRLGCNEA